MNSYLDRDSGATPAGRYTKEEAAKKASCAGVNLPPAAPPAASLSVLESRVAALAFALEGMCDRLGGTSARIFGPVPETDPPLPKVCDRIGSLADVHAQLDRAARSLDRLQAVIERIDTL